MSGSATGAPWSSASANSASRREPTSVTSLPLAKSRMSARVYSRLTVACGAEHRHALAERAGAGGLDRRHHADEGNGKAGAQVRENKGRGGVAGNDHEVGAVGLDQLAHEVDDARDQLRLAMPAIGKEGVIGDVDVAGVGARLGDLAKYREAAEPGIEDENGHGGRWYEK